MKLFDFDGTLADSNGVWIEVDRRFLGALGLEPTREYIDLMGHSIFPIAAQITKEYYRLELTTDEIMARWLKLAREAYHNDVALKPGALEYLTRCRARGERMVLFTACVKELCMAAMERHDLSRWFDDMIFVEELGMEKRDPKTFPMVLDRLGVSAEECTLYEDSPGACAAAKAAGLTVVGVYDDFYAHCQAELRASCHRYIHSLEELLE